MKFVIVLSIACLISFSCRMGKSGKEQKELVVLEHLNHRINKDIISLEQKDGNKEKDSIMSKQYLIQGIWAENKNENAIFYIENDSLTYMENLGNTLYYRLMGDTLFIHGDMLVKYFIVKLNNDSLWLKTDFYDEITKLYKRK